MFFASKPLPYNSVNRLDKLAITCLPYGALSPPNNSLLMRSPMCQYIIVIAELTVTATCALADSISCLVTNIHLGFIGPVTKKSDVFTTSDSFTYTLFIFYFQMKSLHSEIPVCFHGKILYRVLECKLLGKP